MICKETNNLFGLQRNIKSNKAALSHSPLTGQNLVAQFNLSTLADYCWSSILLAGEGLIAVLTITNNDKLYLQIYFVCFVTLSCNCNDGIY